MYSTWLSAVFLPVFYIYVGCFIYNSIAWECYCSQNAFLQPIEKSVYCQNQAGVTVNVYTRYYAWNIQYSTDALQAWFYASSTCARAQSRRQMHVLYAFCSGHYSTCISTFIVICPAIFHSLKRIMVQEKVAQPFREFFLNVSWMLI